MSSSDMFLAMTLKNAQRAEARGLLLSVEGDRAQIHLLLGDGSSQPLQAPPAAVVLKIIEALEDGQTEFLSSVFCATVDRVRVQRGETNVVAHIERWEMEAL